MSNNLLAYLAMSSISFACPLDDQNRACVYVDNLLHLYMLPEFQRLEFLDFILIQLPYAQHLCIMLFYF